MKKNIFLKLLTSLPVILLSLYFIPFLGVCLMLFSLFININKKRTTIPIILMSIGILLMLPKVLDLLFNLIKFDKDIIPYFNNILSSKIYTDNIMNYGKLLFTIGVIFLILSYSVSYIFNKLGNNLKNYIMEQEKRDAEISQRNDLIMKEKREKAKNTKVVYCPHCGADNILTSNIGTCKYCRRKIEAIKEKK